MNLAHLNLFGHGLSSGQFKLPNAEEELVPGRYYVSVKGSHELCGRTPEAEKRKKSTTGERTEVLQAKG